jgi:hypothetical protein
MGCTVDPPKGHYGRRSPNFQPSRGSVYLDIHLWSIPCQQDPELNSLLSTVRTGLLYPSLIWSNVPSNIWGKRGGGEGGTISIVFQAPGTSVFTTGHIHVCEYINTPDSLRRGLWTLSYCPHPPVVSCTSYICAPSLSTVHTAKKIPILCTGDQHYIP